MLEIPVAALKKMASEMHNACSTVFIWAKMLKKLGPFLLVFEAPVPALSILCAMDAAGTKRSEKQPGGSRA